MVNLEATVKYTILLLVSVFFGAIVFVILGFAAFAEFKDMIERKANLDGLTLE